MSKFIFSTLANDNQYTGYVAGGGDMPRVAWAVLVKGGAGVANARIVTPRGVMTEVTDEEFKLLQTNVVFGRHFENGFIHVEDRAADPEKIAADMTGRDTSAPLVDADFEVKGDKAPTHAGKQLKLKK